VRISADTRLNQLQEQLSESLSQPLASAVHVISSSDPSKAQVASVQRELEKERSEWEKKESEWNKKEKEWREKAKFRAEEEKESQAKMQRESEGRIVVLMRELQEEKDKWELREAEWQQQEMEWKREEEFLNHEMELLEQQVKALKSQTSERGVIGLSIEQSYPWRVLACNEVMDEHGDIINDALTVGHELAEIDGWQTGDHEVTEIFQKLAGPPGTLIHATFRDPDTQSLHTIIIQRHKPLGGDAHFGTAKVHRLASASESVNGSVASLSSLTSVSSEETGGGGGGGGGGFGGMKEEKRGENSKET
jgi:C-terminal processing protease CtpA/Prc